MIRGPIRHLLLDADEVFQHPGPWATPTGRYRQLTPEFLADVGELQQPALRGEIDVLEAFDTLARQHGIGIDPSGLVAAMWGSIVVDPESLALVDELRGAGYGVHLGTNQDSRQARFMRETLGYDDMFDVGVYPVTSGSRSPRRRTSRRRCRSSVRQPRRVLRRRQAGQRRRRPGGRPRRRALGAGRGPRSTAGLLAEHEILG